MALFGNAPPPGRGENNDYLSSSESAVTVQDEPAGGFA